VRGQNGDVKGNGFVKRDGLQVDGLRRGGFLRENVVVGADAVKVIFNVDGIVRQERGREVRTIDPVGHGGPVVFAESGVHSKIGLFLDKGFRLAEFAVHVFVSGAGHILYGVYYFLEKTLEVLKFGNAEVLKI
jgi:hypothetical protein